MLKAGPISFALCAALFFAVSSSKETQAKLRDVQAQTFEENGAIKLENDIEKREGM